MRLAARAESVPAGSGGRGLKERLHLGTLN